MFKAFARERNYRVVLEMLNLRTVIWGHFKIQWQENEAQAANLDELVPFLMVFSASSFSPSRNSEQIFIYKVIE